MTQRGFGTVGSVRTSNGSPFALGRKSGAADAANGAVGNASPLGCECRSSGAEGRDAAHPPRSGSPSAPPVPSELSIYPSDPKLNRIRSHGLARQAESEFGVAGSEVRTGGAAPVGERSRDDASFLDQ